MKVKDRIKHLRARMPRTREHRDASDQTTYEALMSHSIVLLREAWERAVEEVALNGVVMRFQRAVHTQRVRSVVDLTDEDYREIQLGMDFSSREMHDDPAAAADPLPSVEDVEQEINRLARFVDALRRRRDSA